MEEKKQHYILVQSFKKMKYENNKPTGGLYTNSSYINTDSIMFITKAKTSIIKPEFNIDYHETGSLIHLVNGTTLTCTIEPKLLVEQIEYITNK